MPDVWEDELSLRVPIYDCVHRFRTGFNSIYEDALKYNLRVPAGCMDEQRWFDLIVVHRLTGSGSSFYFDHGWRKREGIVHALQTTDNSRDFFRVIAEYEAPIVSCEGNRPPMFKEGMRGFLREKGARLATLAYTAAVTSTDLMNATDIFCASARDLAGVGFDFICGASMMDVATYMPEYLDPRGDCPIGPSLVPSFKIIHADIPRQDWSRRLTDQAAMFGEVFEVRKPFHPLDLEDVYCDYARWCRGYLPKERRSETYDSCCVHTL